MLARICWDINSTEVTLAETGKLHSYLRVLQDLENYIFKILDSEV